MADNLFAPNQLGTPAIVFNPLREALDANQFKITDLPAPTVGTDAANKNYVDASVGPGGGAANWANNPAVNNVNMNGFGINSATTIVASGDITASGNSLIATAGQVATNTSAIATKAPSANPIFTGSVIVPNPPADANSATNKTYVDNEIANVDASDWSTYPAIQSINLDGNTLNNAGVINFSAAGDLSAILGLTLNAGGAANISAGLNASVFALGNVSIGGPVDHITIDGNDITGVDSLTATGVSATNVSATNTVSAPTISGTTITATGNMSGNNVSAVSVIQGATVRATGIVEANSVSVQNNITSAAGTIRTLGGSIIASGSGPGQGVIEGSLKAVAPLGDFDSVFTAQVQLGNNAGVNELTLLGNDPVSKVITVIQEGGTGTPGGVVDTRINPITASLTGSTLNIGAKNGAGVATTMASVDIGGIGPDPLFAQFLSLQSAGGSTFNISAAQMNSAIDFEVNSTGSCTVNLPNGVPAGTAVFIKLNSETSATFTNIFLTPPGVAVGSPPSINIKSGGGCFAVAMNQLGGDTQYAFSESFGFVNTFLELAGGTMTGTLAVQDTTNIEAKNITTALLTPLPSVGFISALGPLQVEGGNFLVANPAGSEIGLAASASPPLDQVATITYNFTNDDLLHINKVIEAPGAVLDGNDVVPLLTFKDARTFFVSKQGADTNSGAANAPFLTVQAAVSAALATSAEAVVDISPGVYTENITIASVQGILIRGSLQNDRMIEGTILKGVITVQVSAPTDSLFNNQVVISGCFIQGIIRDTSTKQHTLIVDGCRIEGDTADGGEAIDINMTSTDGRTVVRNCVLTQEAGTVGRNPVVQCNVGRLQISECELTARDDASCVLIKGTAHLVRMYNCSLASTSPSANPDALLQITSTTASLHSVAQTLFQYTSTTSKTAPGLLVSRASPGVVSFALNQVVFALAGTLATGNVVQFGAGTTLVLFVADNRSFNTPAGAFASLIQSGATVLPLTRVGETVVQSVNAASGALNVVGTTGISVATAGNNITISALNNGTLTGVGAGTGIAVNNTNPAVPVVSNTGVLRLIAGTNVSLTAETGEITISAVGGGGSSAVNSVSAGTGISLTGTAEDVIVNNAGVLSVGVGNGLVNTGTASAPVLAVAATGTITFQDVAAVRVAASGTGDNFSSFAVLPRISGTIPTPTEPSQLVPLQFVNQIETGVLSVSAGDASIQIGGTATAPTVSVAVSGVSGGSYTNAAITVLPDGRVSAAASGAAPVLSVSGTATEIASTGGSAPVLSLVDTVVIPGAYTNAALTVDSKGRLTAVVSGADPVVSVSGTAEQITVSGATTTPVVGLAAFGAGEATYTFPASIAVDDFGRVISATTGVEPVITTVNGNQGAVSIAAGTNITIDNSVPGTITVNASGGGGGGVQSVSQGTGVNVDNTDAANPIVSLPVQGSITPGTYTQVQVNANGIITFAEQAPLDGVQTIVAGTNITVDPSDPANPIVAVLGFQGLATGDVNMQSFAFASDNTVSGLNMFATNGFVGHFTGFGEKYAIPDQDATADAGMARCKLDNTGSEIAATRAFLYDQLVPQTVAIPFATSGASFVIAPGASITTAQTLLITQSIQPNAFALNYLTARTFGILGNIVLNTSTAVPLRFTITFQKNGGVQRTFAATYLQNNAFMTVPINNISVGLADSTIEANDLITIRVFAQTLSFGSATTVVSAPPFIPAILSLMSLNA